MSEQPRLHGGVAELMPASGNVFERKYRIVKAIGAGGFARVYQARFEDVGRDVAIKVLVPEIDPPQLYPDETVNRFLREARVVSDLRSPHTITLHDFGRTSAGLLYMVFEYVDGVSLDKVIKQTGPMPAARVVNVMRQALLSLREAHMRGLLHRDIKPANMMLYDYLGEIDQVKVLDFGIAKRWTHQADGAPLMGDLTEAGTVIGTPRYMSPEQIVGQQLGPSADLYGLGLVAFEMLTGAPAAPEKDKTAVVRRHLGPEPILLPAHFQTVPGLAPIVHRMVAKDHQQRYQTTDEVLADLSGLGIAAPSGPQPVVRNSGIESSQHAIIFTAREQPASSQQGPEATQAGWSQGPAGTQRGPIAAVLPPEQPAPQWGAMPGFGAGAARPPQEPTQGFAAAAPPQSQGAIEKPARTFIQLRAEPSLLEIEVPPKPTKKSMIVAVATGVFFMISVIAMSLSLLAVVFGAAAFAWGLSLVFRQYRLVVRPDSGYERTLSVLGLVERHKRGPAASMMRFEARGTDASEDTVLTLITHEGEFTVADGFSEAENRWVAASGNAWIEQMRAGLVRP